MVPAEEEEVTNINTNPFILVDPGVAEAARCLGAVNFSNLDRYKLFSQLTSYLIIKQESKNKPRISPKFHKQPSHNCCLTTHPDLKQRCRETNLLEESLKKKYTQPPITFKFCFSFLCFKLCCCLDPGCASFKQENVFQGIILLIYAVTICLIGHIELGCS